MKKSKIVLKTEKFQSERDSESLGDELLSEYINEYDSILEVLLKQRVREIPTTEQLFTKLKQNQFQIQEGPYDYIPRITLSKRSKRTDIIVFKLAVGPLSKQISMLIIGTKLNHDSYDCIGTGSFGEVYSVKMLNEQIVAKSIPISKTSGFLFDIITEYFYFSIGSALGLGPYLPKMGFDILCFQNRIEFFMEKCLDIQISKGNLAEELGYGLQCLHKLKIVHRDIKPQNIMFSPKQNKHVLIDYGMSKMIKQKQGRLSKTLFVGTYMLVCKQMKNLYHGRDEGYVDLYYNDCFSIKMSCQLAEKQKKMNSVKAQKNHLNQFSKQNLFQNFYTCTNFIYGLHFKNKEYLLNIILQKSEIFSFFTFYFFKFCREEQNLNPISHPYFQSITNLKGLGKNNEEQSSIMMKIFQKVDMNNLGVILDDVNFCVNEKSDNSKTRIQLKKILNIKTELMRKKQIKKHFYFQCLLLALSDHICDFTYDELVKFINNAINNFLPQFAEKGLTLKIYKLYTLMQSYFRQTKQKIYLEKIRFYYEINLFEIRYSQLQDFIMQNCCERKTQILQEAILSYPFMRALACLTNDHNNQYLKEFILFLQEKKTKYPSKKQEIDILKQILIQINTLSLINLEQYPSRSDLQNSIHEISFLAKNKHLNDIFIKKLTDLMMAFRQFMNFEKVTDCSTVYSYYYFENATFSYRLSLYKILEFNFDLNIDQIFKKNPYLNLYKPIQFVSSYIKKNSVQAQKLIEDYLQIMKQNKVVMLKKMLHSFSKCLQNDELNDSILKVQIQFFFIFVDGIIKLNESKHLKQIQTLALETIMDHIILIDSLKFKIYAKSIRFNDDEVYGNFIQEISNRIQIFQTFQILTRQQKNFLSLIQEYLSKTSQKKYEIGLKIISDLQLQKYKKQEGMYSSAMKFLCLIWNLLTPNTENESALRAFILKQIQTRKQQLFDTKPSGIPTIIISKCLLRSGLHINFLKYFQKLQEVTLRPTHASLQISYMIFFRNANQEKLLEIMDYVLQTETLSGMKNHSSLLRFFFHIFFLTFKVLTRKQKKRFLILCSVCHKQSKISQQMKLNIESAMVGCWYQILRYKSKRKILYWKRSMSRKTQYDQELQQYLCQKLKIKKKSKIIRETLTRKINAIIIKPLRKI